MSKRSLKITTKAIVSKNIKGNNLKKKIKILNEHIAGKILEMDENLELENLKIPFNIWSVNGNYDFRRNF